ncbi:MAG: DUF1501 domain-containing protein [Planctomycetota bacterium]|nr:MAG: DUF1501 domain-containing protein [Planctomycetota bacterium]
MLDLYFNAKHRNCAGVTRRDFVRVGALTAGGLTMAQLQALAAAGGSPGKLPGKAVICIWLDGGPTHMETFDPKPQAPAEYRGPFGAIQTSVPGVYLSEVFPKTARLMHRISLVRSVYHNNGDHFAAGHWMWTGYHGSNAANRDPMYPSFGAIIAKHRGPNFPGMPAFVAVPYAAVIGLRPGYQSAAFLGVAYNPFDAGGDPNSPNFKVPNLNLPSGVSSLRMEERRGLLRELDRVRREIDQRRLMEGMDEFNRRAFELVTGERARKAFDIHSEDPKLRDLYGRNSVGQSALLARRLVEAGVTCVTVHSGGWDNHSGIENAMKAHGPRTDAAISALITDLIQRGLYDDVIVMVMGEFGRTPRVNPSAGRDHWGNAMTVLLAGGGIRPGVVVGATDEKGTRPIRDAVKPAHILHTVYRQMGIDPSIKHINRAGRPIPVLNEGEPIGQLV